MPPVGVGTFNFRQVVETLVKFINSRANRICASTCDGLVLRMHYTWTFYILLAGFLTVWYSWYHQKVIACVSTHSADVPIPDDQINICLSYPFVKDDGERRYVTFYRWISWSLLILAGIYRIPRKASKSCDNSKCTKLAEDIAANKHRYDQFEKQLVEIASRYMVFNLKTHNGLYWKFVYVNILCVIVDIFALFYLDFVLQGRFIQYGFRADPYNRDRRYFQDFMSQTFPPFVFCEIKEVHKLLNDREEIFGCHLTIMELYEKYFLAIWIWLIVLIFATLCYIAFLLSILLPCVRPYLLRTAKPAVHANENVSKIIKNVVKICKVGDIYLLYRLKSLLSHARFYELMECLANPNLYNKGEQLAKPSGVTAENQDSIPLDKIDGLRNRIPNVLPRNLNSMFTNSEKMTNQQQAHQAQQMPLINKGNTAINIERFS